uniref:Peptidyl-prolyl cis-trans isomerase cyp40-like n=2 Tax=Tetraselmis sp. GSL018 TaxID=582737 RepID=A0A061QJN8_9CHLO
MSLRAVVVGSLSLAAFLASYHVTVTLTTLFGNFPAYSGVGRGPRPAPEAAQHLATYVADEEQKNELWRKYIPPPPPPPPAPDLRGKGPVEWADGADSCHAEPNAEYDGEHVVRWGETNPKDCAAECCQACKDESEGSLGCNTWVWCGEVSGCSGRGYKECWLKHQKLLNPNRVGGKRGRDVKWTSGFILTELQREEFERRVREQRWQEAERLDRLRADLTRPMVYLDVAIAGELVGRITIVLLNKEAPRAAENFRALCTGEKGIVPAGHEGAGRPYSLKGAPFYRIIDQFIIQTGANTDSVFGGAFKDDPGGLELKHEHKGLLSMANNGPDSNTSHMSIMLNPAPHLDGKYTIFGQVVEGMDVVEAVNRLAGGRPGGTADATAGAVIVDTGQLRPGLPFPEAAS